MLSDFGKHRTDGRDRCEYMDQLRTDLANYYGYQVCNWPSVHVAHVRAVRACQRIVGDVRADGADGKVHGDILAG